MRFARRSPINLALSKIFEDEDDDQDD